LCLLRGGFLEKNLEKKRKKNGSVRNPVHEKKNNKADNKIFFSHGNSFLKKNN
jgi:hypothetical protein